MIATLALVTATAGAFAWATHGIDPSKAVAALSQPRVVLLTADGKPFARRGDYKEAPVDAAALPAHVVQAVLAIEDRRYYRHFGLDFRGVARATVANMNAGATVQGGSTITQQLAKTYVGSERTFSRKLREGLVALWLERKLTKDQILSYYLSSVYFGDGAYGLRAAAKHYFRKEPEKLSLAEAAMLAGVIKAPSRLAPTHHLRQAQGRSRVVLAAMVDAGYVSPELAAATPSAKPLRRRRELGRGGYFADWISPRIRVASSPAYGEVEVRTTLDARLQAHAELVVQAALAGRGRRDHFGQVALVAMRPDGSVVAMVGGRSYARSQFNRAVQAKRQPGSAFKLFVYLAALRDGATPESLVSGEPIKIGGWSPRNSNGAYDGPVSLEQAFAQSSNVAAVRISEHVGRGEVIRAAQDLGVASELKPVPSLALGTSEATLLEMTSAYAAVAAGAYPVRPVGLSAEAGASAPARLDWESEQEPLLRMLRTAATQGTGRGAALILPSFGKTGTTQEHRDAWFIGFAGELVVGVWIGNDDEAPMRAVGGGAPVQIWRAFMETALRDEIVAYDAFLKQEAAERQLADAQADRGEPRGWLGRLADLLGL